MVGGPKYLLWLSICVISLSHVQGFYRNFLSKPVLKLKSMQFQYEKEKESENEWDSKLGVWKNNRAKSSASGSLSIGPPFYLFGYGSLLWRPGDLEKYSSYKCEALGGHRRVFAQRSCDHRGDVDFPGVVVTLVHEDTLSSIAKNNEILKEEVGKKKERLDVNAQMNNSEPQEQAETKSDSVCHGLVWHLPDDQFDAVIAELDYREKGGYQREIVKIRLLEDTPYHVAGSITEAIVYVGNVDNPNFQLFLPFKSGRERPYGTSSVTIEAETSLSLSSPLDQASFFAALSVTSFTNFQKSATADIIAAARGPSGPNCEYLFRLAEFLTSKQVYDPHVHDLAIRVKFRMGPWRRRLYESTTARDMMAPLNTPSSPLYLLGWGSNEYGQLGEAQGGSDIYDYPIPLTLENITHTGIAGDAYTIRPSHHPEAMQTFDTHCQVVSGGAISALLDPSKCQLFLWGDTDQLINTASTDKGKGEKNVMVVNNIVCAAMGHNQALLLDESGWILSLGEEKGNPPSSFVRPWRGGLNQEATLPQTQDKIMKVAVGLRRCAAITVDGRLCGWGERSHASVGTEDGWWRAPNGSIFIDVACGAHHTVAIDDRGGVWSFGNNKHQCLGRTLQESESTRTKTTTTTTTTTKTTTTTPQPVEGLEEGVRWQRVTCGWSHTILRGVKPCGTLTFACWGRADMGQLPIPVSDTLTGDQLNPNLSVSVPRSPGPLSPLPLEGRDIMEVWCGSEFTIAADANGGLWGCGWNEHGNLTNTHTCDDPSDLQSLPSSSRKNVLKSWCPILTGAGQGQLHIGHVWEGAIAAGGSSVICLSQYAIPSNGK